MTRYRLFSDRQRDAANAGKTDVYQYDVIPPKTRVQVRQLLKGALGKPYRYVGSTLTKNKIAVAVREVVCHEQGRDNFGCNRDDPQADLLSYIETSDTPDFIDVLEFCCVLISTRIPNIYNYKGNWEPDIDPESAIDQINFRLRDGGIGYQFEGGQIVRVDSQFMHAEAVKPALSLLNREGFAGPQAEFLNAHEHYRAGRYKEAISEAAKSFESMMKAVCDKKGWTYPAGSRASDLLKVLRANNLWPDYLDKSFDQLLATLASGLPVVRNEDGAHGQGAEPKAVPEYVAAYALHLAASKIVLIGEAGEAH